MRSDYSTTPALSNLPPAPVNLLSSLQAPSLNSCLLFCDLLISVRAINVTTSLELINGAWMAQTTEGNDFFSPQIYQ